MKTKSKKISKGFLLSLLALICAVCILSGCSKEEEIKNVSISEINKKIEENVDISQMRTANMDKLKKLYDVKEDDVEEFILYTAPTNIKADELAIIKVKKSESIENIKNNISKRVEKKGNSFKDYLPEEYYLIENHILTTKGNYIFFVISDKAEDIENAFNESFK